MRPALAGYGVCWRKRFDSRGHFASLVSMVYLAGFEPAVSAFGGLRFIQLSYRYMGGIVFRLGGTLSF